MKILRKAVSIPRSLRLQQLLRWFCSPHSASTVLGASGLAATFMAWGPIDDVGFLARNSAKRGAGLCGLTGRILHMSPERIDLNRSVLDLGMDSLMGIELGMAVEESFGVKLSIMAIAEGATVHTLSTRIVDLLDECDADEASPGGAAATDVRERGTCDARA